MPTYTTQKEATASTVAELQNALRDESADQPITAALGGNLMLRWLKDVDTGETIIEVDEDYGDE